MESDSDDDWDTIGRPACSVKQQRSEQQATGVEGAEQAEEISAENHSPVASRTRNKTAKPPNPSPKQRKRVQAQARRRDKEVNRRGWRIKTADGRWKIAAQGESDMLEELSRPREV